MKKHTKKSNILFRIILILVVIGMLVLNIFSSKYKIDSISISLLVVLIVLVMFSDFTKFIESIRKLKIGDNEIELEYKLNELDNKIKNISIEQSDNIIPKDVIDHIKESFSNQRSALITIGIEIEKRISELIDTNGFSRNPGYFSPTLMLNKLIEQRILSNEVKELFSDFWKIRNMASHSYSFDFDENRMQEISNIGIKLLTLLYKKNA